MKSDGLLYMALLATVLLVACQPAAEIEPAVQAPSPAELQAQTDAYIKAVEAGDAAALAGLFTTDAVLMPSDRPAVVGKEAIQAYQAASSEQISTKLTIDATEREAGGDWAYSRGTFTAAMTPKAGGETIEIAGKWMSISKRQADGMWRIHRHIWNTDEPMPQPPEN